MHVGPGEAHKGVLEGRLGAAQLQRHHFPVPAQLPILADQPVKGDRAHCKSNIECQILIENDEKKSTRNYKLFRPSVSDPNWSLYGSGSIILMVPKHEILDPSVLQPFNAI